MKVRKRGGGRPREESKPVGTPVDKLGEKDTIMHYNAVLIEDLKSKMDLVLEYVHGLAVKMDAMRVEFDRKIEELRSEMNLKFDALNYKIDKVEERLSLRIDKIAARLDGHESRFVALEACR